MRICVAYCTLLRLQDTDHSINLSPNVSLCYEVACTVVRLVAMVTTFLRGEV